MSLRSRIITAQTLKEKYICCNTEWTSAERRGEGGGPNKCSYKRSGCLFKFWPRICEVKKANQMNATTQSYSVKKHSRNWEIKWEKDPHHHNPPFQGGKAFWPLTRRASTTKQHPLKQSAPLSSTYQHRAELVHKVTKLPTHTHLTSSYLDWCRRAPRGERPLWAAFFGRVSGCGTRLLRGKLLRKIDKGDTHAALRSSAVLGSAGDCEAASAPCLSPSLPMRALPRWALVLARALRRTPLQHRFPSTSRLEAAAAAAGGDKQTRGGMCLCSAWSDFGYLKSA